MACQLKTKQNFSIAMLAFDGVGPELKWFKNSPGLIL